MLNQVCNGYSFPDTKALLKSVSYRIQLYEREKLQGQKLELTDDCPSVPGGSWILYEMEYRRLLDQGAVNTKIVSLQRLTDLH
uniref:Beta/gamma crystallin 'Greek key' domain-containing protein n=1 Tax=Amazona collaria TaxID=241587 RepID=A0A8B9GGM6_9PSIT